VNRIGLAGARGRMGRMLVDLIVSDVDLELASGLEHPEHPELGLELAPGVELTADARVAIEACDVWLDFSLPEAATKHAALAADCGRPLVCGTTGFTDAQKAVFADAAEKVAVVLGSNMSHGVYLLTELVRKAAAALPDLGVDVEIVEAHHKHKQDAPSGTALQLAQAVVETRGGQVMSHRQGARKPGEVGIAAIRGGDVCGAHEVMFLGPGEQLLLTHRATTREHFASGALQAVRFVQQKPAGLYTMAQVFSAGATGGRT